MELKYQRLILFTICQLILFSNAGVLDKEMSHKSSQNRAMHGHKLSDKPKSSEPGDYEYDHGAFLGDEYSETFDDLSPEEAKRRLMVIVDKIDTDKDGKLSEEELIDWVKIIQEKEAIDDSEEQWKEKIKPGQTHLSWDQYRVATFGDLERKESEDEIVFPSGYDWSQYLKRDQRRFNVADINRDGSLDRAEFSAFVHPEEHYHMKDIVVAETLEDLDTDKDGKISITEFIGDLWRPAEGETEPEWVTSEKEQFTQIRDKNRDGALDFNEISDWIIPDEFDLPKVEAHHLMSAADHDQDSFLSRAEILNRYDVFVGSSATHFGQMLMRHDEF
eukprot:TRINITY_DN17278_c0_g1_i1.p1 TRINITY_DN17278_c0_g1~~TRINITY_DN17278_c0_g1_i1.p1  ORF type:complete len:332 (+),score=84.67 TRINITY_DN17278_c0_g1_i1:34-1029(+)